MPPRFAGIQSLSTPNARTQADGKEPRPQARVESGVKWRQGSPSSLVEMKALGYLERSNTMKMLCTASMAALLVSGGLAFAQAEADAGADVKLSQEQCGSIWSRADAAGSGSLSDAQASDYVSDFSAVDTNADGELSAAEFMAGCEQGLIRDSASTGAGEGAAGSDQPARDSKSRPDFF